MAFSIKKKSVFNTNRYLLLASLLIMGCVKESSKNFKVETLHVDSELASYFEKFVQAGQERGITINLKEKRIEGFLINIDEKEVVGQCSYNSNSTRKVNIDIKYWNSASSLEKEFVIFHELGHCYLERSHLETQTSNGRCVSIMHSGVSGCRFRYSSMTKSSYLDELFQ